MKQECGWFDEEDHSSVALSVRLSADAADLQSVCVPVPTYKMKLFSY